MLIVSVPSTGRSGLQPDDSIISDHAKKFQYPLRVEVGCNQIAYAATYIDPKFQYPLRVEVGCNLLVLLYDAPLPSVSVPSTGRSGLQLCEFGAERRVRVSFSTLYGSKWVATCASQHCVHAIRVSVPSTGRSGLQRRGRYALAPFTHVSVPSTGRSGLQLTAG